MDCTSKQMIKKLKIKICKKKILFHNLLNF